MNEVKEQILSTLRSTNRDHMEDVIQYMLKNGYFKRGCHGHHRYDGGLADHAWQTYLYAKELEEKNCKDNPNHKRVDMDSLAICCLLHDFCDCNGKKNIGGHGLRSAVMILERGLNLSKEEYLAIRFHMSLRSHIDHPMYEDARHCHLRYIVHQADGLSAHRHKGNSIKKI